ncbi:MAG TPA: tetratricopeptide repeat protein [Candidatus Tectomicrobia bacterium]|nr:tetratricopeptide repeat protein [Candidatus Tectomicrobia bacterium]
MLLGRIRASLRGSLPALVAGLTLATTPPAPAGAQRAPVWAADAQQILERFHAGDHVVVIQGVEGFYRRYPLDDQSWPLLLLRAESRHRLGQAERALREFREAVPFVERLHNVARRGYAWVYFRIGALHGRLAQWPEAIAMVERGLQLEPQNAVEQIRLGELLLRSGDRARALRHFQDVRGAVPPRGEPSAVLAVKLERLGVASPRAPVTDVAEGAFYPGVRVKLLPVGAVDERVVLPDLCVVLEARWLVGCEVLPPIRIPDEVAFDRARNQLSGDRIIAELVRRYPTAGRGPDLLVAVTDRDIYGRNTNYVFSWQSPTDRVGVVTTYRFLAELEDFYEPQIVATRRLAVQLLSTTSALFGMTRATRADCPTAYPNDVQEFLLKGSRLCESEIQQRDAMLRRMGGTAVRLGPERAQAIARVEARYRLD